jgi:hypothetical protein
MKSHVALTTLLLTSCARNWVNYPPQTSIDSQGRTHVIAARAAEFNGSDLNGDTVIEVTNSGVRVAALGGINNSISTAEGYRTARYGAGVIGWTVGILGLAHTAAGASTANTASNNSANIAATKAGAGVAKAKLAAGVQSQAIKAGVASDTIKAGVQSQAINANTQITTEAIKAGVTTIPR